ncbi:hypothetical protein FD16_GL001563 [Paucilactobacillus suebicus DSM 5007 = KCTC 3549]|uniref:Uncharacterized protein n=2 Tax=Paucilactobacillus suebicus TaxID=152335 RepID=A0A0R1VWI6_9LACO|nr:hypothetical protein FD16_GL001563 [Paucilactobacillus suebicus DSM 5007 = KCTC 3549]
MQVDISNPVQQRRFEKFGIEVCRVEYNHRTKLFTVNEYRPEYEAEFDDLDLVAIEVYESLAELASVF